MFSKYTRPLCEECDIEMNPYGMDEDLGWACNGCGWSFDIDSGPDNPVIRAEAPKKITLSPMVLEISAKYFWSGPAGHFYTDSLELGEKLLRGLVDQEDYTATDLTEKK